MAATTEPVFDLFGRGEVDEAPGLEHGHYDEKAQETGLHCPLLSESLNLPEEMEEDTKIHQEDVPPGSTFTVLERNAINLHPKIKGDINFHQNGGLLETTQMPSDEDRIHGDPLLLASSSGEDAAAAVNGSVSEKQLVRDDGNDGRDAPRVLPSVAAFTVQCAMCLKWRLIPSKQKYEEIRESILQKPFLCAQAASWRQGTCCDDPSDLSQDTNHLWAIDKPNIPLPPSGWERLLVIRGAGATRFADVYYVAPSGKKLRSLPDIERFLVEHPEYVDAGVRLSQFSFVIPRPLDKNYVKKRDPSCVMRGSIAAKKLKMTSSTEGKGQEQLVRSFVNAGSHIFNQNSLPLKRVMQPNMEKWDTCPPSPNKPSNTVINAHSQKQQVGEWLFEKQTGCQISAIHLNACRDLVLYNPEHALPGFLLHHFGSPACLERKVAF